MIIINLQGGLGNQLFQYAFGRRLALIRQEDLYLDESGLKNNLIIKRNYSLAPFNIKAQLATPQETEKIKYPFGLFSRILIIFKQKVLRQFNIGWQAKLFESKNRYFNGFFQSYKYLEPIREQLLTEITLKEPLAQKYSALLESMVSSNSVSLHIRRGDYINDSRTKAEHNICGLGYYTAAIKLITSKISDPVFFIFSDDIAWAKENFKLDYSIVFVSDDKTSDSEELILMSKCKHNIIANSSFSFWGAWLNQNPAKIVIAPTRWNNRYQNKYKDLLPESWLKL